MSHPENLSGNVNSSEISSNQPKNSKDLEKYKQIGAIQAGANQFEEKLAQPPNKSAQPSKNPERAWEENAQKELLQKYGLSEYLVEALKTQGITVKIAGPQNNPYPYIDTSSVYHGVLDRNGTLQSGKMSSLPINGSKIDSIQRSSDGTTVFQITDTRTGEKRSNIFSQQKFEEIPYANQLPFVVSARADVKRRDEVALRITNPTHGRDQHGLNPYLIDSLNNQGINVQYSEEKKQKYPRIDTSNVYLAVLDSNGNMISSKMSALPIRGKYIDSISRSSDGFTIFDLVDVRSGKLQKYMFSRDPWENVPYQIKGSYRRLLEKWQ